MNAETLKLEVDYRPSNTAGVVDVVCNRKPTPAEMPGVHDGLPFGCELNLIYPEEEVVEIIGSECCGVLMGVSTARRDPFTDARNPNFGKPWCSVCGKFGK